MVLIFAILGINGALQRGNRRSLVGICDFLLVGFEFSRKISLNFQNGPQNQQLILRCGGGGPSNPSVQCPRKQQDQNIPGYPT